MTEEMEIFSSAYGAAFANEAARAGLTESIDGLKPEVLRKWAIDAVAVAGAALDEYKALVGGFPPGHKPRQRE